MSALSPSNRSAALCVILSCAIAPRCFAEGVQQVQSADPFRRYRTIGGIQGMYEVREEARKFLKRQTPPAHGKWMALMPDVRTFVPTCAVAFKTRWAVAADNEDGKPGVIVTCPKSMDKTYKKWDAFVGAVSSPKKQKRAEVIGYRLKNSKIVAYSDCQLHSRF